MLLLIVILILLFSIGGPYYGYRQWGPAPGYGMGIVGLIVIVCLVLYLAGYTSFPRIR